MSEAIVPSSALVDALKTDDDKVAAHICPDFAIHLDGGIPYGGTYRDPDGLLEQTATVFKAWAGDDFEPRYELTDATGSRVRTVVRPEGKPGRSNEPVGTMLGAIRPSCDGQAVDARLQYFDTHRRSKARDVALHPACSQ